MTVGMDLTTLAGLTPAERALLRRAAMRAAGNAPTEESAARWRQIAEAIYPGAERRAAVIAGGRRALAGTRAFGRRLAGRP